MPKKKGKFFVIEARRMVPLLFLLALLVGLTVYDNFFRVEQAVAPVEMDEGIAFTTTDWGEMNAPVSFTIAQDYDEWIRISSEMGLSLPDYPFNAAEEMAVFTLNGEIKRMDVLPQAGEVGVRVQVEPIDEYFHVVTVARQSVGYENAVWEFVDGEGQVLSRIIPFQSVEDSGQDDQDGDDEDVIK